MNSSSDQDSNISTVYDVDVDTRHRSSRLQNRNPSYDEEQLSHVHSPQPTTTDARNASQPGFVSPSGVPNGPSVASYGSSQREVQGIQPDANYLTQPQPNRTAIPPSVQPQQYNPQGHHQVAAPPPRAQRNQIPIQEIRIQPEYHQGQLP